MASSVASDVPASSDVEKRVQFWIRIFNGFGLPTALLGVAIFAGYKFAMPMYEKQTRFIEKLEEGLERVTDNSQVMADSLKAMSEQITTQTKSIQANSARLDTIAEKIQHN